MLKTLISKVTDFITIRRFLITFFSAFLFIFVLFSFVVKDIDDQFNLKINYRFRDLLGKGPDLDRRVKVVIFNDVSMKALNTKEPTLEQWTKFFEVVNRSKNVRVMIDKVFNSPGEEAAVQRLKDQLGAMNSPVVVSAVASPRRIKSMEDTSAQTDFVKKLEKMKWSVSQTDQPKFDDKTYFYYGPTEQLLSSFTDNGHIVFLQNGRVKPYFFFSPNHILPHISMFAVDNTKFGEDTVVIPGQKNHKLNSQNEFLVNIVPIEKLIPPDRTYNFEDVVLHKEDSPLRWISDNDVLIVLPYMYTGGSDWVETPIGKIQGGRIIVSTINQALTGKWIHEIGMKWPLGILLSFLVSIFAVVLGPLFFSLCFVATNLLLVGMGLFIFAYYDLNLDWLTIFLTVCATSFSLFIAKMRAFEKKALSLKISLGAALPQMKLKSFMGNPNDLMLEPCMKVVTVMFIDIEGFSGISDTLSPKECFLNLQKVFHKISHTVHEHGGVVDKSLGDGLLIFFGYYYDGRESYADHADAAVRCAVEIQREVLKLSVESVQNGLPVFPLRIGIHSGSVYFGNLGDNRRIDINIIGAGVNFAQRLEAACEAFRVLVSNTTRELASCLQNNQFISTQRLIPVKHQEDPISVYEIEPITGSSEDLKLVTSKHRDIMNLQRHEERWPLSEKCQLHIRAGNATGKVIDISHSGMLIELDHYYGRNLLFSAEIECTNKSIHKQLVDQNLLKLALQCRWGRRAGHRVYYHGVKFTNLNKDQRTKLLTIIAESLHDADRLVEING